MNTLYKAYVIFMCYSYCVDSLCRCYISLCVTFGFQIIMQLTNLRINNGFKKVLRQVCVDIVFCISI